MTTPLSEILEKMVKVHEETHEGTFSQRRLREIEREEKEEIVKPLKGQSRKAGWMFAAYEGGDGGDFARFRVALSEVGGRATLSHCAGLDSVNGNSDG